MAGPACFGVLAVWRRAMFGGAAGVRGSGGEDDAAQLGEGVVELFGPRPAGGEVQGEFAGGAGDPSGGAQVAAAEGVGRDQGFALSDAAGPAGKVVGGDVQVEPGGVGGEAA